MKNNRKKITKYTGGGDTGLAVGASALSGALGGSAMGPLGMLGGGLIGAYQGWQADKMQRDQMAGMDEARALADAERERLMANEERMYNQQILEQYPVKGMQNPRFEGGGLTKTSESKGGDNSVRDGFHKAMKLDTRAGMMALNHPEFADMFNMMTPEELEMLAAKKAEITAQAEGIRGKGVGPAIGMFTDLDLSFIKPLRERAGVSKSDLTDWTLDTLGVEGAARQGAKTAAYFKSYEHGGPTGGEIRPTPGGINMTTGLSGASNPHESMIRPDGGMENLLEFIDPTGLSSWDDAYRAYQGMKQDGRYLPNFGEATDMFGAIPLIGKVGKGAKLGAQLLGAGGRGVNLLDTAQDLYSENLARGGMTGPRYEAEGGEMIQYQPGDTPAVYGNGGVSMKTGTEGEIKGPSHAQGGVDMSDEKGARIYSKQLTVNSSLMAKLSKL
jgi:hypothetical protein